MTTTSFTLSWTTDLASDGIVEYGLTEALGSTATGATGTADHSVDLTGLEAGQIYYARAISTLPDGESAASPIRPYATVSGSSGDIHVYFNGTVDASAATDEVAMSLGTDLNDTVAAWILSAQHTLDVAAYNLNDQTLIAAFNDATANGVEIRWIYEGQNANTGLGALDEVIPTHPRTDGEGSGMHNKFIIGDAEYTESAFVLTGSTNLTTGNLVQDLNNVIVFEDQSLARAYTIEFHEMWGSDGPTPDAANAKFGPDKSWNTPSNFLIGGSPVELYFSPSDGTTNAIRQEIEAADSEFEFALLAFTRDDLGDAIADLGESFFVNPIGAIEQVNTTGSEFDNLQNSGVQVYAHNVSPDLHHKYAIVDHASPNFDPVVITGSHNWSSSAENVNDENTVIVHDARVANLYHQEFRGMLIALGVIQSVEDAEAKPQCLVYPEPNGRHVERPVARRTSPPARWSSATCRDVRCWRPGLSRARPPCRPPDSSSGRLPRHLRHRRSDHAHRGPMNAVRTVAPLCLALFAVGCSPSPSNERGCNAVTDCRKSAPCPIGTRLPTLTASTDGPALLFARNSEPRPPSNGHGWKNGGWHGHPRDHAGDHLLMNWADRPAMAFGPSGEAHAHWLEVDPRGRFHLWHPHRPQHGRRTFLVGTGSTPPGYCCGRTWVRTMDDRSTGHGVRLARWSAIRRASQPGQGPHGSPGRPMEGGCWLVTGNRAGHQRLYLLPLAATPTADGHLLAYRDRTPEEIRDFSGVTLRASTEGPPGWSSKLRRSDTTAGTSPAVP